MPTPNYQPLDDSGSAADYFSRMAGDHDVSGGRKKNKYAFACAILASMTSVLLGYGMFLSLSSFLILYILILFITCKMFLFDSVLC